VPPRRVEGTKRHVSDRASCIATTADLVIDGANGVCADARDAAGTPLTLAEVAPFVGLALLAAAILWLRAHKRVPIAALGLMLGAAALPGAYAALFWRADRPAAVVASLAPVDALHDAIRDFATEHGCAELVRSECLACEPIARLALVDRRCDRPAPIELYGDALEVGCQSDGVRLRCGRPPAERAP
jgi:hypothetical protein